MHKVTYSKWKDNSFQDMAFRKEIELEADTELKARQRFYQDHDSRVYAIVNVTSEE